MLTLNIVLLATLHEPDFFMRGHLDALSDADSDAIAQHYVALVEKYQTELTAQKQEVARYIKVARDLTTNLATDQSWRNVARLKKMRCVGQIGQIEAAMLYILLREYRPKRTIEIGALCGSSTRWMLAALEANGLGQLITYDLHGYTPAFIGAAVPNLLHRWKFIQGDAIAALGNETARFDADALFIDALHRNSFAQIYTERLLRKAAAQATKPLPVFVHDIFTPFMMPRFRPCQLNMSFVTLVDEVACMKRVLRQERGLDVHYSEKQPAGEGVELMSWLARTARSKGLTTFSMYANPRVAWAIARAMGRPNTAAANNPSIFFQLIPDH